MTQPRPYYFMVTFWGAKYQDFFYSMCLPTMLAPNNLPVLKDRPGSKFIICTTEADWAALSRRPLFQELKKYVEPFLIAIPPPTKDDLPQLYMSYGHRLAMKKAYDDQAIAGFLAPDLFVSDGMVARTVELIEQGKKAILCPALRYAMEPAMERLAADHRLVPDVPISLSPEYLSAIAVNSLHSELQRYDFEGPYFDDYPIWSFWRVPCREGLILYTVSWALLLGDYTAIPTFDDEFLEHSTIDGFFVHRNFGHLLEKGQLTYLNDSHDVVLMSLTSETELTYLPLQRISMNDYKLGWIKRIADIKKFHQSDVLDPFRRRAYQVPIVIRADALDEEYRRTIESSRRLIRIAVRTPYQVLAGPRYMLRYLPPLWEAKQRFLQQVRQVKWECPGRC